MFIRIPSGGDWVTAAIVAALRDLAENCFTLTNGNQLTTVINRSFTSRLLRTALILFLAFIVLSVVIVLAFRWIDPPTTAFILEDRVSAWREDKAGYQVRQEWVGWSAIAASVKVAVIASEDQTFPSHHGFDLKSINSAIEERERGRRVRGASTISQQVAKNLFLWPGKNLIRKGLEAWFTVLLEALWPKHRILEVHLNIAEFGRGVYGVGAAAKIYFRKPAARLNASEAALLAAVLPNPIRLKVAAPSPYVRSRQAWILGQMRGLGGDEMLKKLP